MQHAKTHKGGAVIRVARRALFILVTALLALSTVYAAICFLVAGETDEKSNFLLMLTQCALGIIGMLLPRAIERHLHFAIPDTIVLLYFAFIFMAIFLGEVLCFYYTIPLWDSVLHTASSAMLTILGAHIVDLLYKNNATRGHINPILLCLFAFCFALSVGALWEIYEFSFDNLLGLNMQKFRTESGEALIGNAALFDTMKDIIIDTLAAALTTAIIYIKDRRKDAANGNQRGQKAG